MFCRSSVQTGTWSYLLPFHKTHLSFPFCCVALHSVPPNTQLKDLMCVGTSAVRPKWEQPTGSPQEGCRSLWSHYLSAAAIVLPTDCWFLQNPLPYRNHVDQTFKLEGVNMTACPKHLWSISNISQSAEVFVLPGGIHGRPALWRRRKDEHFRQQLWEYFAYNL